MSVSRPNASRRVHLNCNQHGQCRLFTRLFQLKAVFSRRLHHLSELLGAKSVRDRPLESRMRLRQHLFVEKIPTPLFLPASPAGLHVPNTPTGAFCVHLALIKSNTASGISSSSSSPAFTVSFPFHRVTPSSNSASLVFIFIDINIHGREAAHT